MAKTIPAEEKVFMVSKSTNTTYSGSAALKAMQEWYTMDDVTNTVRPYQVFTALLTQSGVSDPLSTSSGGEPIILGQTYQITDNGGSGWDFTNIGSPNNDIGTYFIATGTTPNSWGVDGQLDYNQGAPVATVLENTIGNIWFTYNDVGQYDLNSDGLFVENKVICSFLNIFPTVMAYNENILVNFERNDINSLVLRGADNYLSGIPIEIRVYN